MKQKRYWLRGGMISLGIVAALALLALIVGVFNSGGTHGNILLSILLYPSQVLAILIANYAGHQGGYSGISFIALLLPLVVIYFAPGALIGLVYEKIKNK